MTVTRPSAALLGVGDTEGGDLPWARPARRRAESPGGIVRARTAVDPGEDDAARREPEGAGGGAPRLAVLVVRIGLLPDLAIDASRCHPAADGRNDVDLSQEGEEAGDVPWRERGAR